jgi:hypothetical protein
VGQSVAQKVTITGLPLSSFKLIFLPVIVENVTSGVWVGTLFIAIIEMHVNTNKTDAAKINRVCTIVAENCSGIYFNVSLGNIGIIAKLLNYAPF